MAHGIQGVGPRGSGGEVPSALTRAAPPRALPLAGPPGNGLPLEVVPAVRDRYGSAGRDPLLFGSVLATQMPVTALVPDLSHLQSMADVVSRFVSDVSVLREQLAPSSNDPNAVPNLGRVYEFFVSYAERYVLLATSDAQSNLGSSEQQGRESPRIGVPLLNSELMKGLAPDTTATDRASTTLKFLAVLETLGFAQLADPRSGQTALAAAQKLLTVQSLQGFERAANEFEATASPSRMDVHPSDVVALVRDPGTPLGFGVAANRIVVATAERGDASDASESRQRFNRATQGRLGPRLFWNTLHTLRGRGESSVQHRDQMNRVAVSAILALVAVLVIVGVLVLL